MGGWICGKVHVVILVGGCECVCEGAWTGPGGWLQPPPTNKKERNAKSRENAVCNAVTVKYNN